MPENVTNKIALSEMIDALRVELASAVRGGDGQPIRFEVGPVELEVTVAVTRSAEANAGVKFWVIEAGGKGSLGDEVKHRVKVTLEPKTTDAAGRTVPVEVAAHRSGPPTLPGANS